MFDLSRRRIIAKSGGEPPSRTTAEIARSRPKRGRAAATILELTRGIHPLPRPTGKATEAGPFQAVRRKGLLIATGQLSIDIFQLADDGLMAINRTDGTGWEWCRAGWRRDWMDATAGRFAYRRLPLTIVNQTGLWVNNPVGFTAV